MRAGGLWMASVGLFVCGCGGSSSTNTSNAGDGSGNASTGTPGTTAPTTVTSTGGGESTSATGGTTAAATSTSAAGSSTTSASSDTGVQPPERIDCGTPSFASLRRAPYLQSMQPTSARVAWASESGGTAVLRVSDGHGSPWIEFAATPRVFTTDYTDEEVEYTAYDATATGLEPGTQYCYEIYEDGRAVATGLRLETAWTDDRDVRIVAMGDSGNASAEQLAVRDRMLEHDYDVFLHLGDMAYGDGTFPEFKERVFDVYTDLLHKTPTWPTMGNHEYNTDQGQPYLDVYYLPEMALNPDQHEQYYSFDYGDVHFISLQSNDAPLITSIALDGLSDTTMLDWLRADLAASDKPWKIAFFHHPPYTSSERDPNVIVRGSLLPILEEGGVDLVLSGHDHHYERSEPVRGGVPARHEDGGIVYFVAGAGGAGLRETDAQWWTEEIDDTRHSYLSIRISGCTAYGEVIALDGEQLDTFELPGC